MKIQFYLRFHTKVGQRLWISGDGDELGNNNPDAAIPMEYLNEEFWQITLHYKKKELPKTIRYNYLLENEGEPLLAEWGHDREITIIKKEIEEIQLVDTWNHAGEYENAFFTNPFREVLLKDTARHKEIKSPKTCTHILKVKAPLLEKDEVICVLGSGSAFSDWNTEEPVLMAREKDWWVLKINLRDESLPIAYKYGVFNSKKKTFIQYEQGNNRLLFSDGGKKKQTIVHDGFVHIANNTWKGAGVAIPVFSLRSKKSVGCGEFSDICLLVDWAKQSGLQLIQLLPVNDTIATNTWTDSYPYAAISAFALHPVYINVAKVAGKKHTSALTELKKKQKELNALAAVDYEQTIQVKSAALRKLYELMGEETLESPGYEAFFSHNKHWLQAYAAFCYYRDQNNTSRYEDWKTNAVYNADTIEKTFNAASAASKEMKFYCFVQYHLHLQLKEAAGYAHSQGVVLKGDIPIGVYRDGCDTWMAPSLYNMDKQAGAPPDAFATTGQNWGFPTYNWQRMQEDGFSWWRQRFGQMKEYFDAFRIDHILGFFRIWSIPVDAVQGLMGRFIPSQPVHINEFGEKGIWFDYQRFCKPFINDEILNEALGEELAGTVKNDFLVANLFGGYDFEENFQTQQQVDEYFVKQEPTADGEKIKQALLELLTNVIFFEEENSQGQHFHFRIDMEKTSSFQQLIPHLQDKLKPLYIDYFYHRQDEPWRKEAMKKLPQLKASTNMLICGEDLGMVPHCVPEVMKQLGILSLEIQRMPKDPGKEFFHPADAPYLSVITPSTHDMSTIRGWWEENPERTQHFFNNILGQRGDAPATCEAWINRAIVLQHLYSPAMWSIFQLQDILGMSETLRRENAQEERINDPANPKNYWQYRMHINLEELIKETAFCEELKGYVVNGGRGN